MMDFRTVLYNYTVAAACVCELETKFSAGVSNAMCEAQLNELSAEINTAYKELKTARKLLVHALHPIK